MVWRDKGVEVKYTDAPEQAASKVIHSELMKPNQVYTSPASDGYHGGARRVGHFRVGAMRAPSES